MARTPTVALGLALLLATPTASSQQTSPEPTNLVLEVHYYANERPAYQVVPPSISGPGGAWYARFRRVPGWTPPSGSYPVHAVNIKLVLGGDLVRIWISVFVGQKFDEREKTVAVLSLREGEKATVPELTQFGVEPFELALVRVAPAVTELPQVISKAKSIELVTIQPNLSTLPSYRVALRNLSSKNVSALFIRVLHSARTELSSMPQGKEGEPLIPAGGVSEFVEHAPARASSTAGGYQPVMPTNLTIEISTAVFEDGSFEGDVESAITFRAFVKGRKLQLSRIVKVFQKASQDEPPDPLKALELLRDNISALGIEADSTSVQEVTNEFLGLAEGKKKELTTAIEIAMSGIRRDVVNDIQQFRSTPTMNSYFFHTWLVTSQQRYEAWLSRL